MDSKAELRLKAKKIRKTLDIFSLSENFCTQLRQMEVYINANNVLIFYPMQYEFNLLELLSDDKTFYLPKVCGDELLVCPYSEKLERSEFNICEPCSNPVSSKNIELAIVPALMADKNGYRLGYGGGFYDRFLTANPHIKTILPIAKKLFVDELPRNEFDIKVDKIVII